MNSDTVKEILILFWIIIPACVVLLSLSKAFRGWLDGRCMMRRIERQQRVLDALDREGGR